MKKKIVVYCTGGTSLGFGHFFRSRTFVNQAPHDFEVLLIACIEARDRKIFDSVDNKELCNNEFEALDIIKKYEPNIFVFDTVSCSNFFFQTIRSNCKVVASISPIFNFSEEIDFLFSRNINAPSISKGQVFKGLEYAIFNENCVTISQKKYLENINQIPLPIGISMGGGDAANKTLYVLRHLSKIEIPFTFWVLLGEGYKHSYQDLVDGVAADKQHEVILAKTNRSAWSILSNCALGIFAGGLTTVEAIYAGLPSLNIFEKEEHVSVVGKQIFEKNFAKNIGMFNESSLQRLQLELLKLNENKQLLIDMRQNTMHQIDKLGPERIFNILREAI